MSSRRACSLPALVMWPRCCWSPEEYSEGVSNRTDPLALVESEQRQHAVVELAIRDLKYQALAHFPSGHFNANAAWTVLACLAHNLLRQTTLIGLPNSTAPAARTVRRRLLSLPTRLHPRARPHPSAPRRLTQRRRPPPTTTATPSRYG